MLGYLSADIIIIIITRVTISENVARGMNE